MIKISKINALFKTSLICGLMLVNPVFASDNDADKISSRATTPLNTNSPLTGRISPIEIFLENPDLISQKLQEGLEELHSNRLLFARRKNIEFGDQQKFNLNDLDTLTSILNDNLRHRVGIANLFVMLPGNEMNWFGFNNLTNIQVLNLCNIMMNRERVMDADVIEIYQGNFRVSTWVEWKRSVATQFVQLAANQTELTPKQFEGDKIENVIHSTYLSLPQIFEAILNLPPLLVINEILPISPQNVDAREAGIDCGHPYYSRSHKPNTLSTIFKGEIINKISEETSSVYFDLIKALFEGGVEFLSIKNVKPDDNNDIEGVKVEGDECSLQ